MSEKLWTAADKYIVDQLVPADPVLDHALEASTAAGLPPIQVSAAQGKMLYLMARMLNARRILEIGTLGGYSTIWLARALSPGGRLITLEFEPLHARVAQKNIEFAKLSSLVELRVGAALETLPKLAAESKEPFDLVFIDADKPNTLPYFEMSLQLSRPGTVIIADNVVRQGGIVDPNNADAGIQGMRRFLEALGRDRRVSSTALQTVGAKGYDGFAVALVIDPEG